MGVFIWGAVALIGVLAGLWFYLALQRARIEDAEMERDFALRERDALRMAKDGETRIGDRLDAVSVRHKQELDGWKHVEMARDREGLNNEWD